MCAQVHFQRSHVKRAHSSCPIPSLMCRLSCKGFGRGHYHCPFCLYVMHDLTKLRVHQHKLHLKIIQQAQFDREAGRTIEINDNPFDETLDPEEVVFKTCEGGFVKGKKK